MFSSILFTFVFYGICFYGTVSDDGGKRIISLLQEFTSRQKLIIVSTTLFFLMFISFWPQQNKFIYYYDYSGYWLGSVNRANYIFSHNFFDNVKSLYFSINNHDYNIFLPTILALPMGIIGNSFVKYAIICCILFLLPTYFVQGLLGTKVINNPSLKKSSAFTISFILSVFFVGNYFAVFRGYVDVAYLLPMTVAIYLLVDYDFSKINTKRNIAIALNLILIWVCRRYTVYFLIGYVLALAIRSIIYLRTYKKIKNIIINFIQIGTVSLGILLIFFKQFILRALLTDYAKMYSGFNAASTAQKIASLGHSFGYIIAVLIIIAGIFCLITKKQKENYLCLLAMIIIEPFLFWQTQIMDLHHKMILNVPVFTIILMVFNAWNVKIYHKNVVANFIVILSTLILITNFLNSFMNDVSFDQENKFFAVKYYPLVRNDIDALNGLAYKLNKVTEGTENKIYVVATGGTLNFSILRNLHAPKSLNTIPNMLNTYTLDLRDGFPSHFLQAKYVVATQPVQVSLSKGQHVIRYIAENIQRSDSHIGKHYKLLDEINLQNKIVAKIYEKVSEYTEDDLQKIRDYFTDLYPEDKKIFADRIFIK